MHPSAESNPDASGSNNFDLDDLNGLSTLQSQLAPLVRAFTASGFRLFLVGGVVRDLLAAPVAGSGSDVDLTTDAEPEDIKRLIRPEVQAIWTQGERFGTIGAQLADGSGGFREVEITTHRAEQYSSESRKPEVAFGTNLREDLSRRDFTVNAMAIELAGVDDDVTTAELRDPFAGRDDLVKRILRTPLSPEISFEDDPLRMMRAARFMSRFELTPVAELESAATDMADRLAIVSVERVAIELERLLAVPDPSRGLAFLDRTGLLDHIIGAPVDAGQALSLAAIEGSGPIRRAGLLFSAPDPAAVLSRLRYSKDDRRSTVALIKAVRTWMSSDGQPADTRRAVDGVVAAGSSHQELLELAQAVAVVEPSVINLGAGVELLAAADDLGPYVSPLSGPDVMDALGVEPGPIVGRAQRFLKKYRLEHGPLDAATARRLLEDNRQTLEA